MRSRRCTIDGCDRPHKARGWCALHYLRWHRTGETSPADTRPYRLTDDDVRDRIEDFEMLRGAGVPIGKAAARCGVCVRTLIRDYQRLGLPMPPGMWTAADRRVA